MTDPAPLVRTIDELEEKIAGPVTIENVLAAVGSEDDVKVLIAQDVLLVDHRLGLDSATGATSPVGLCRLNRPHPAVRAALDG